VNVAESVCSEEQADSAKFTLDCSESAEIQFNDITVTTTDSVGNKQVTHIGSAKINCSKNSKSELNHKSTVHNSQKVNSKSNIQQQSASEQSGVSLWTKLLVVMIILVLGVFIRIKSLTSR
jgi:cobalamin biosynthesis Mg chelatase CobN